MFVRRVLRRLLSVLTVVSVLAALGATSLVLSPAANAAADLPTQDVEAGIDALVPFIDGLATVGKLGDPLPGLDLRPGSPDGLDVATALSDTFSAPTGPLGGNYGDASTLDELVAKLQAVSGKPLPGGRTVTITASHTAAGGVDTLPVTVAVERQHTPTGFAVAVPGFTFDSAGGLDTDLTMRLAVTINRASDGTVWLSMGSGTPSLTVSATTTMPAPANVNAAIGILKVTLGSGSAITTSDTFASTFSDPNNDGRLDKTEYGAAGSSGGLVGIDWGTTPANKLDATLHLTADTTGISGDLSAADATVQIGSLDPSTTALSASVTDGTLTPFDAFERLTPKDLADSLGELAQFLTTAQMTHLPSSAGFGNISLPFMKGSLADAARVNEAIANFLTAHVKQIPVDPSTGSKTVGKPDFASIQDLIGKLNAQTGLPGGAKIGVTGVNYDGTAGKEKLSFDISVKRTAGSAEALDQPGTPTVSDGTGVQYGPTSVTLTHVGDAFDPTFIGRTITAGAFTAAIKSISNDGKTATLDPAPVTPQGGSAPASYWKGATDASPNPTNGTPYSVAAADPQTGEVQLGDTLKTATGLVKANAQLPIAQVTPSYSVDLPVVLDLSPPTSTTPTTVTNPDGTKTVVNALPTPAQRVKLHTGGTGDHALITLDVPITSDVHAAATVGFLGVKLDGSLAECTTGTYNTTSHGCDALDGTHLLEVDLRAPSTAPTADSDGNLSLPDFYTHLVDASSGDTNGQSGAAPSPQDVLSAHVNGEAHATLSLSVPDAPSFFSSPLTISLDLNDITDPTNVNVTAPDASQLTGLKDFDISGADPKALFGAILAALGGIDGLSSQLGGSSGAVHDALATPIPLLGGSVKSLIGGSLSGGDRVTYGDDGTTAKNATITDPKQTFTSDDSKALAGRALTAGTAGGVIASASGHVITLAGPWPNAGAGKPTDGTTYSVADELKGAVDYLTANSADSLQDVVDLLNERLGAGSGVSFSLDHSSSPAKLHLIVDWKRAYSTTQPVTLNLGSFNLAGAQAGGTATLGVNGEVKADLILPLSAAAMSNPLANLSIDPSTSAVSVKVNADLGTTSFIKANAGPLAISLGKPYPDPNNPQPTNLEAKAALGVALADATDSAPVSLATYAGNLGVHLNQGVDPVTCTNATSSDNLAICAALPVYTSSDGTTWKLVGSSTTPDDTNSIKLRLPQATGTDLAAQFDTSGTTSDGKDKLAIPADLTSAIASSFLDLSSLDDGLLGYLKFAEQSLRLASAGGKLPLIGDDLQQGANFLGNLQDTINGVLGRTALPNGKLGTVKDVKDKLGELSSALDTAKLLPNHAAGFSFDLTCTGASLHKVTPAPTAADDGTKVAVDTVHYEYKVVATRNDGTGDTLPSDPSNQVTNVAPVALGAGEFNNVNWAKVDYATGYKILRSDDAPGDSLSTFTQVGTVNGGTTLTFHDTAKTGTAYSAVGAEPALATCDDSEPASDISGINVAVDLGQGDLSDPTKPGGLTAKVPMNVGVPGLSFHAVDDGTTTNDLTASVAWALHLKFGLSRDRGFYVDTQDHDPSSPAGKSGPEFKVGVTVDLPSHITGQLAFLNVDMRKNTSTTDPNFKDKKLFQGVFSLDLKNGPSAANCSDSSCTADDSKYLDLAGLQNVTNITDYVKPLLSAEAALDWNLKADTTVGAALPGIGAEFKLHWKWNSDTPGGSVLPDVLEFDNVTIDPGQFITGVLGPIFKKIADAMKPMQPVLDTIQAPIPVLSDLSKAVGGDDVTIASLAEEFNTLAGGPDIQPFIDVLTHVNDVVKALTSGSCPGGSATFCINVGSFNLSPAVATRQQNTPDLATQPGYITPTNQGTPLADLATDSNDSTFTNTSGTGDSQCTDPNDASCTHPGFTFPALQSPTQLFQLLLGHDVTLAQFDSGPLSLGFSMTEEFGPVYAPPPVDIVMSGSAGVTLHVIAGFDTYGIRKAVEAGKVTPGILDSLYFGTTDTSGKPVPVLSFTGSIAAGAEVNAVIIKAGVEGGISLTVNFYWNDPDNDGKFRFSEFLATALNNPICLFNVGGELDVFLKVFITIGFSPFDVSFDFTLVNVKLLDFSLKPDCNPPPPLLGGVVNDDTLYIYAGPLATDTVRGAPWGENLGDESWVIRQNGDGSITVNGLGIQHTFGTNPTKTITTVVFDGRGYSHGKFTVLFQGAAKNQPFDKTAIVFGGNGNDNIRTGSGASLVDGGPGDDNITTGDRPDPAAQTADAAPKALVAGGPGNDVITTGNAHDWVAGDASLMYDPASPPANKYDSTKTDTTDNASTGGVTLSGTIGVASVKNPTTPAENDNLPDVNHDGDDLITVGSGGSDIWGGGGKDKIGTAQGSTSTTVGTNTIVGGSGSDLIASGSADDEIYTGKDKTKIGSDDQGPTDTDLGGATALNTVDTGKGADTVYGSQGEDDVTTHSLPGKGATVYGGGGNDLIDGADGPDALYGGPGNDTLIAQPATVDKHTHTDQLGDGAYGITYLADTNPAVSKTLVGGGGSDRIYGGDGPSTIYGDHETYYDTTNTTNKGADECKSPGPALSDSPLEHPNGGVTPGSGDPGTSDPAQTDEADLIIGGSGADTIQAGGGGDIVNANGGADVVCGEGGVDTIDAGSGTDTVWAGTGNDVVFGGAGEDSLYGNGDDDTAYGGADNDTVEGNDGMDILNGGAGNDTVVGGTEYAGRTDTDANGSGGKAVGDTLYGDIGRDLLIGDNGVPAVQDSPSGIRVGTPYDLDNAHPSDGAGDHVYGGDNEDAAYGGLGDDVVDGGNGDDYLEGNDGVDHITGDNNQDDIIGGSSAVRSGSGLATVGYPDDADVISGGDDQDVVLGDNGAITRGGTASAFTQGRGMTERGVTPYDWNPADGSVYGGDTITGDAANDVVLGEGGADAIHGNAGDDYLEGNQGADTVSGDAGQDDIVGGSSQVANGASPTSLTATGEPDTGDTLLSGGDDQDVAVGDNGFILRTATTGATTVTGTLEDVTKGHAGMTQRRINLYDVGASSPGGGDAITGDAADDALFGGAGADTINGNGGDDYVEGDQGGDFLHGDAGQDDVVGGGALVASGSADAQTAVGEPDTGDTITGDVDGQAAGDPDVILGDDGSILRIGASSPASISNTPDDAVKGHAGVTARRIRLYDVTDAAAAANSGPDDIVGQGGDDAVFGQGDNDRIKGGAGADHLEGGQAADFVEGDAGDDDIVGGSATILSGSADQTAQGVKDSGDVLYGGGGDDVVTGDNSVVVRVGPASTDANYTTKFTNRLTVGGTDVMTKRWLRRLDLSVGSSGLLGDPAGRYGSDRISGGQGVDTVFGQDGGDYISGGSDDDYIEGGGGADVIRGDLALNASAPTNVLPPAAPPATADSTVTETVIPALVDNWVGTAGSAVDLEGPAGLAGQDDVIGGSSLQGFRDGNDTIEGDDEADVELGDNGALVRDFGAPDGNGIRHYTVYTARYPRGSVPANAAVIRHNDTTIAGMTTTRFCVTAGSTCEPTGAFGDDTMYGDGGEDTMWGQDGNDTMRGGAGNDDMYGELGDDYLYGDSGQDAMLGDRGGIVDTYVNGSGDPAFASPYAVSVQAPPAITYKAFTAGTLDRRVDLLHDVNGASFVGSGTSNVMPHDGVNQGGNDHLRGGSGHDNIHTGYGDDLANGDSGGDAVFGDDGADVLWGGKGCDPTSSEDYNGTCVDPSIDRGTNDAFVDYTFGGKGGTSPISQKGDVGSDILDWQPRGSYPGNCTTAQWPQTLSSGTTIDPCDWFLMTNTYNDTDGTTDPSHRDNQTHHGIDWMYGGWDRDVMQADQADEGPNTGDRLLDWNGAYNLYSHCNPSYGGYNDVRQLSPDEQTFVQKWSYGVGIGQQLTDVTTAGTSAYDEVAIVYQADMKAHGTGPDYPTTPGHFDSPNACAY